MFNKERNTYTEQSVPEQRKERREALLTRVECDALRGLPLSESSYITTAIGCVQW